MKLKWVFGILALLMIVVPACGLTTITGESIVIDGKVVRGVILGYSTGTKPTNVLPGTFFLEQDTGMLYAFNGTEWKPTGHPVIVGTSSDTKPTEGVMVGTLFVETDTGMIYSFDGSTWKQPAAGGASKLSQLTIDTELDMNGYSIINTSDILPATDNVSSIGSSSLRYNALYAYAIYAGDIRLANGWFIAEAENYGLGDGVVLVSPNGEVYKLAGSLESMGNINTIVYIVVGLVVGLIGGSLGGILVVRKLGR